MNGKSVAALVSKLPALEDRSRVIDELLRRTLRVGDPKNPVEVATALRQRYGEQAKKLDEEATGLPVTGTGSGAYLLAAPSAPSDSPGEREYRRVQSALEADLTALVNAPANRDYSAEFAGWRSAILRQYGDGADAARTGQDPAKRQAAFLAVRTLGDYARVARLVGMLHLEMNQALRRFARSVDEAASVIRILTGEALYDAGLGEGGVLLEVPLIDLRQRADALIQSLRVLAALGNDDADDYGAALASYGALLEQIDRESAPELKVYLRESSLALALDSIFDDLSGAMQRSDAEALRQIGGTLPVRVADLRRLYEVAVRAAKAIGPTSTSSASSTPASMPRVTATPSLPTNDTIPLSSSAISRFILALKLFIESLDEPRAGARLVDLAVPLAMAASRTEQSDGDARLALRELVSARAELARQADCFLACCGSDDDDLRTQVKVDFVLYHVDRAIDLYAEGHGYPGQEEIRAVACGLIAENLATQAPAREDRPDQAPPSDDFTYAAGTSPPPPPVGRRLTGNTLRRELSQTLHGIATVLKKPCCRDQPNVLSFTDEQRELIDQVMHEMNKAEVAWGKMAGLLAPRCLRGTRYGLQLVEAGLDLLTGDGIAAFMPQADALTPYHPASPPVTLARSLQRMIPAVELHEHERAVFEERGRELEIARSNIASVLKQLNTTFSSLKQRYKLTDHEQTDLRGILAQLEAPHAVTARPGVGPVGKPAPIPVPAPKPPGGEIAAKDRDAVLVLLFLTSRALDDVARCLSGTHGDPTTQAEKAAQVSWKRWLEVLRAGKDIRDHHPEPEGIVRGWMEPGHRPRLQERISGDLRTALDTLFDVEHGEAVVDPKMDSTVLQTKQAILQRVTQDVFALNPKP